MRNVLALLALAFLACSPSPTTPLSARVPAAPSKAQNTSLTLTVSPTALSVAVGQSGMLFPTYTNKQGRVVSPNSQQYPGVFWGCQPDNCRDIVRLLPGGNGVDLTITGLVPGSVTIYAGDGSGTWTYTPVTVTP